PHPRRERDAQRRRQPGRVPCLRGRGAIGHPREAGRQREGGTLDRFPRRRGELGRGGGRRVIREGDPSAGVRPPGGVRGQGGRVQRLGRLRAGGEPRGTVREGRGG